MDSLCQQLISCKIEVKPKLYDMMIYDFVDLSIQYNSNSTDYYFNMKPEFDYVSKLELKELICYIEGSSNTSSILHQMILERYPGIHIDNNIVESMIDYYIECLDISTSN